VWNRWARIFTFPRRLWLSCACWRPLHLARGYPTLTMSEFIAMMEPRASWVTTAAGDVGWEATANVLYVGAAETAMLGSMQTGRVDIVSRCVSHPRTFYFPGTRRMEYQSNVNPTSACKSCRILLPSVFLSFLLFFSFSRTQTYMSS